MSISKRAICGKRSTYSSFQGSQEDYSSETSLAYLLASPTLGVQDDSHFKSAAPTNSPKRRARITYIVSPARNATNAVTREAIKPKTSTLQPAPLANAYANSFSFCCFSRLLLAWALSLLDTLLECPLLTLMLSTFRGIGGKRPGGLWSVWRLRNASCF